MLIPLPDFVATLGAIVAEVEVLLGNGRVVQCSRRAFLQSSCEVLARTRLLAVTECASHGWTPCRRRLASYQSNDSQLNTLPQ